jgi:hypothetical protein
MPPSQQPCRGWRKAKGPEKHLKVQSYAEIVFRNCVDVHDYFKSYPAALFIIEGAQKVCDRRRYVLQRAHDETYFRIPTNRPLPAGMPSHMP